GSAYALPLSSGFVCVESAPAMDGPVGFENISRRSLAHYDVLQAHQAIKQRLGTRWTTGNINIDRNGAIDALHGRVRIEGTTRRSACAHCNRPLGLRHLIVNATNYGSHLERDGAGDDDEVALPRAGTKDTGAEAIDIKTARAGGHHFYCATG